MASAALTAVSPPDSPKAPPNAHFPAKRSPEAIATEALAAGIEVASARGWRAYGPPPGEEEGGEEEDEDSGDDDNGDDEEEEDEDAKVNISLRAGSGLWAGESVAEATVLKRTPKRTLKQTSKRLRRRFKSDNSGVFPFPRDGVGGEHSRLNAWREALDGGGGVPRASLGPPRSPGRTPSTAAGTQTPTADQAVLTASVTASVRKRRAKDRIADASIGKVGELKVLF